METPGARRPPGPSWARSHGGPTHLHQLVEGLIDEDERDEEGKDLLGETGDEAHQEAALQGHHEQGQQHQSEADPHAAHQVLLFWLNTYLIIENYEFSLLIYCNFHNSY